MFQPSITNNAMKTTTMTKNCRWLFFTSSLPERFSKRRPRWSRPSPDPPRSALNPSSLCPFEGEVIYRVPPDPEKQWWAVIDWILQHSWVLAFIPTPMGENWSLLRMEIIDPWREWMSEITNDLINNEDPLFPDHMWRRHQSRHCWLRIILENQNAWSGLRVGWESDQ